LGHLDGTLVKGIVREIGLASNLLRLEVGSGSIVDSNGLLHVDV
jgi:hypothetical protein